MRTILKTLLFSATVLTVGYLSVPEMDKDQQINLKNLLSRAKANDEAGGINAKVKELTCEYNDNGVLKKKVCKDSGSIECAC